MTRDELMEAVTAVAAAGEATNDRERSERLARLADRLRTQAERDATPALGVLDRVVHSMQDVAEESDEEAVVERLERAREHVFAFLETMDDRGMKQHGHVADDAGDT